MVSPFNEGEASCSAGLFIQSLDNKLIRFPEGAGLNQKGFHIRMMLSPSSLSTGAQSSILTVHGDRLSLVHVLGRGPSLRIGPEGLWLCPGTRWCLLGHIPTWVRRSASGGVVVILPGRLWRSRSGLGRYWPHWTPPQVGGPDLGESLLGVASGLGGVVVFLPGRLWRGSGLGRSRGDRPGRLFVKITVTGFQGGGGDYGD